MDLSPNQKHALEKRTYYGSIWTIRRFWFADVAGYLVGKESRDCFPQRTSSRGVEETRRACCEPKVAFSRLSKYVFVFSPPGRAQFLGATPWARKVICGCRIQTTSRPPGQMAAIFLSTSPLSLCPPVQSTPRRLSKQGSGCQKHHYRDVEKIGY